MKTPTTTSFAEEAAKAKEGTLVTCPYCDTSFPHTGKLEFQKCPGCSSELLL